MDGNSLTDTSDPDGAFYDQTQQRTRSKLKTFTPFPRLTPELRNKIWTYACFIPRYIDIWYEKFKEQTHISESDGFRWVISEHYSSHNAYPSLLLACSESRTIGLQHYMKEFGSWAHSPDTNDLARLGRYGCLIYVNWACDVIFLIRSRPTHPLCNMNAFPKTHLGTVAFPVGMYPYEEWFKKGFNPKEIWLYAEPEWLRVHQRKGFKEKKPFTIDFIPFNGSLQDWREKAPDNIKVASNYKDNELVKAKECFDKVGELWKGETTVHTKILLCTKGRNAH